MKGMEIEIYKASGRSYSNGGITAHFDRAIVVGPGIPELDDEVRPGSQGPQQLPVLRLLPNRGNTAKLVPVALIEGRAWTMFGGCFGWSTDSRFREAVQRVTESTVDFPVPIHDRVER